MEISEISSITIEQKILMSNNFDLEIKNYFLRNSIEPQQAVEVLTSFLFNPSESFKNFLHTSSPEQKTMVCRTLVLLVCEQKIKMEPPEIIEEYTKRINALIDINIRKWHEQYELRSQSIINAAKNTAMTSSFLLLAAIKSPLTPGQDDIMPAKPIHPKSQEELNEIIALLKTIFDNKIRELIEVSGAYTEGIGPLKKLIEVPSHEFKQTIIKIIDFIPHPYLQLAFYKSLLEPTEGLCQIMDIQRHIYNPANNRTGGTRKDLLQKIELVENASIADFLSKHYKSVDKQIIMPILSPCRKDFSITKFSVVCSVPPDSSTQITGPNLNRREDHPDVFCPL